VQQFYKPALVFSGDERITHLTYPPCLWPAIVYFLTLL